MTTPSPHDISRQLSDLLDSKAERLEGLIAQAEQLIARLEHVSERQPAQTQSSPVLATASTRPDSPRSSAGPKVNEPQATSVTAPVRDVEPARDAEPTDSLRRAIYALADAGRSPAEISRELDEHIGKVELILALRFG